MEDKSPATPDTISILQIVDGIDKDQLALPEFQRDFVWDISRTYDLFDSLVRDVFIGSIIYGIPSFGLTCRELDKRPRKGKGKNKKLVTRFYDENEIDAKVRTQNFKLILDGQQRITSLYRAVKGIDSVYIVIKNQDELDPQYANSEINEIPLEDLLFSVEGSEDPDRMSIRVDLAYTKLVKGLLDDDIQPFFSKLNYLGSNADDPNSVNFKNEFRKYLKVLLKVSNILNNPKMVAYFLLDMSAEKFALFFERSNSLGVSLTFMDILVAKLISGFNLRDAIEEFEENHPQITINRELIARAIAFIVSEGKNVDKQYILKYITAQHFIDNWQLVTELYTRTFIFLRDNHYIINNKWIPYPNTFIPIMMFLNHLPHKDFSQMTADQAEFLDYWYWSSVTSQRYIQGTNLIIIADAKILISVAENKKLENTISLQRLGSILGSAEDIVSYYKKGSTVYVALLNFVNYVAQGLPDWNNGGLISFDTNVDDHHIFPKSYLQEKIGEDPTSIKVNSVANRTLIPKITNINISGSAPKDYMAEIIKKNPNFKESLKKHMIPEAILDGKYDNDYDLFLEDRSKMMFDKLYELVISKRSEIENKFVQTSKPVISN